MYSATIDLVAECQKWLRNVAYVKTDGQTGGALQYLPSRAFGAAGDNKTILGRVKFCKNFISPKSQLQTNLFQTTKLKKDSQGSHRELIINLFLIF